MHTLLSN